MSLIPHRSNHTRPRRPFTTIYCDDIIWLHQKFWDSSHHESFAQNRYRDTANTDLPNRLSAFSGSWILLIKQEYQGWAEFHCHNQGISINHLILSKEIDWAKKGQGALLHLVAALFQDPQIDIIEIPLTQGGTPPITGSLRTVWSPHKHIFHKRGSCIDILQIQRSWLHSEEGKKPAQRMRPLLSQGKYSHQIKKRAAR
ncbi:MAG: hypothetical protein AB8C84_07110 [Oligoflexales bacterium]